MRFKSRLRSDDANSAGKSACPTSYCEQDPCRFVNKGIKSLKIVQSDVANEQDIAEAKLMPQQMTNPLREVEEVPVPFSQPTDVTHNQE